MYIMKLCFVILVYYHIAYLYYFTTPSKFKGLSSSSLTVGTAELNAERNDNCYVITFNIPFHSGNMKSMRMRFCPHLTCPKTCKIG